MSQLPKVYLENIIAEPQGKDTAPCIGFASVWIKEKRGDEAIVVLPADHLIRNERRFAKIILAALEQAEKDSLVTIGIKPTRAEIEYGYLQVGEELEDLNLQIELKTSDSNTYKTINDNKHSIPETENKIKAKSSAVVLLRH